MEHERVFKHPRRANAGMSMGPIAEPVRGTPTASEAQVVKPDSEFMRLLLRVSSQLKACPVVSGLTIILLQAELR